MAKRPIIQVLPARKLGGAARLGIDLSLHLLSVGGAAEVWLPGEGPAADECRRLRIPVRVMDLDGSETGAASDFARSMASVLKGYARSRPAIMHFHSPVLYGRLSRITRWLPCKQLVHIHIETEPQLYGWAFRSPPDAIITCANFLRDAVQEGLSLCPKATPPIYSVQNAIQLDRYRPNGREQARKRIGMDTRSAVVLMLANLAPHKGQHIAIQAVENLVQRGFDVECWLAGEDRDAIGYESKLMHQAKSAGLGERVRFLGYRNDAEQLLQASDFFILPSTHEGLPLSILEAQACKVPVIASPVAGIPEVITDGVTGFLASPDRPEDYADSIAMLMEATEKRSQITEAAYKHVSAYNSWQHYCKSITEVYDSLS